MVVVCISVIRSFRRFIPPVAPIRRFVRDSVHKPQGVNLRPLIHGLKPVVQRLWMAGMAELRSKLIRMFHRHGIVYPESAPLGTESGWISGPGPGC